jgi:dynein heavy chain
MASKKGAPATPTKDAEEKVVKLDPRAEWLGEQIVAQLKLKSEKWDKLVSLQENCDIIQQFLDTSEVNTLLFILNARDDLTVTVNFPSSLKKKGAFVLKNTLNEPIAETLENNVTIGDLASNPLDYLNCILEEVYLPLLTNSRNMDAWPEVVAMDVLRHFYKVNGAVYVISGKTKGKTLLPLPHGNNDFSENDKALLHTLESAVIDWTYQIKEVIKSNSATPLEEGLYPTPQVEIDFWEAKEANLKCIYQQLSDDKFQAIADLLQSSKSTYYPAFQQIFDEVKNALEEATDINLHLTPLRPLIETLSSTSDFNEMMQQFPPLLHVIMLIWNHSKYYNVPGRVIVILQEICNEIIDQAQNFIQPNEIFGIESDEALEKINLVYHACTKFKSIYYEYKAKIAETERPWNFDTKLAFSRFDQFILRIKQLSEFFDTIIEFNRLEKIEIGGTKGKILSSEVVDIFNEFTSTYQDWTKIDYDVLDLNNYQFREDLAKFQDKISDLDRRIGTIICQAFDDCSSIHSRFRLIEGFSGLLARPIIGEIFEKKYYDLLKEYDGDLDEVNLIFLKLKNNPSIHYNMAPITGALQWTHELKERINSVMEKFKELNHKILLESEEAKLVKVKYDEIYKKLDEYEQELFKDWSDNIINDSEANLDKPLLTRSIKDSLSLFEVNFDPKVIALLKEVKYLGSLGIQAPEKAQSVYDKDEVFRNNIFELDHVVSQYNNIKLTVLDVERPLIQERVDKIDKQFEQALSVINWRSDIIDDFIKSIQESVGSLLKIIQTGKNNVVQMQNLMKKWYSSPLIERKDSKKPLNLDDKDTKLKAIYELIQNDGKTIFNYLEDTRKAYDVDKNDPNWRNYADYVDTVVADGFFNTIKCSLTYFLDNMDIEYLKKCELSPILDSRIEFIQNKLTFTPSIEEDASNSFMNIFLGILRDIYQVSVLVKRVNSQNIESELINETAEYNEVKSGSNNENDNKNDNETPSEENTEGNKESSEETKATEEATEGNTENEAKKEDSENGSRTAESTLDSKENESDEDEGYLSEMLKNPELEELKNQLISRVRDIIDDCKKYLHSFDQFSYLWEKDRDEWMVTFLETPYERSIPQEIEEENKEEKKQTDKNETENNQNDDNEEQNENDIVNNSSNDEEDESSMLKLEKFEVEIRKFENIHKTIMALDPEVIFRGWLKVDAKPLKQSLNIIVKKWSYTLTKYLSDETTKTLNEMNEFITNTKGGLQKEVMEGDYDALVYSMGLLHEMKKRNDIGKSFEPLRKTINLLRQFGVDMPEDIHKLLNDLPEVWDDTKKLSQSVKEVVAPLQAKEVDILQQKCNKFEMRNYNFKEEFRQKAPFMYSIGCSNAYELINECHFEVLQMEQECEQLRESCELFELNCPQYKQLSECRKDINMLKTIWDYVGLVNSTFDDWKLTLWTEIDPDAMEQTCREFTKDLRKMDKEIKAWNVYSGVDQHVKDMITSLRAVGELRSSAIRERHWKQLMKTTGVTFVMTDDMKFKDLLSLQLHRYEDDVRNIVDRATKELSMEKVLNDLSKTWGTMEFEYKERDRKGTYILISSEELVETLEDNQVMLQNLMTSKYVSHFEEQITGWQEKLSTVDTVMSLWLEVQKTWSHLENIFLESEDIRQQLPEDSKRFDGIDSDYNELMKNAINTPNAIEACSKEGLNAKLEYLQQKLALCEKSLAEYLETKRLAFPRFYFVSASDLLDILAKGNIPHAVAIHLQKLFDSISKLEFTKDENGNYTKTAIGMYSKEDEYVPFKEPLECVGPVEVWLNHLVDTMRMTLRHLIGEAVSTYEEKPRDQWIFDHPAQVTLTGSQIWWATEVNASFARLEEGYENSMKEYYKKQCNQLTTLITLIQGELSKLDRQMIMTVCTLDVHARDIVGKLVQEKAENAQCFSWQSQLRLRWDEEKRHCIANICDAQFTFCYEYLGDTPRLVITPLTDRCYITLTQSLHLIMGGAPAGPAGTGKTETVKDLGRALTVMVYVFNCSEQMDYRSIGNIYKGLAQSGAWGCFDEFNRISVEVLSVVATQVKSIEDGLRAKKKRFIFQGEEISLEPTVGFFITMNPGYAGRTELPENIKALFRPCSMVVPNLELICEIMLMAEGFVEASILARKFHTLYKLNKELLSKQDHYDWGLRAIKSVLVVAGSLKRSDPGVPEEHVLMRALRDFNLPKIVTDDLQVFNGLINDLFPKIDIPRKRNLDFENDIKKSTIACGLQAEETFVLKVVQLEELLAVRHCVFIIGNAGSGKSEIWKMLAKTYINNGKKMCLR